MNAVFVTGTDTGVGKTLVSAWLVHHWRAAYWKPVQSGPETDCGTVKDLVPQAEIIPSRYVLSQALSPHLAARWDGTTIDLDQIVMPEIKGPLVIEGAGGVLVPLNDGRLIIDLMAKLGTPALIVVRSGLGTINHTLLTLQALRSRAIPIVGVVMNGPPDSGNRTAIEHYGGVAVLAEIPPLAPITPLSLASLPCPIPPPF